MIRSLVRLRMHAVADFCLIPMGVDEIGVSKYIAACQRVCEKSGLEYKMHGYGTGVQGEFSEVMKVVSCPLFFQMSAGS